MDLPKPLDPRVPDSDWHLVVTICVIYDVDPYVIVAIGLHETGWFTVGDGRMPPAGHGHGLGVGSYDSASTDQWAGVAAQVRIGCQTLVGLGIHTIADVAAGKAEVWYDSAGHAHDRWASADTPPNYPWTTDVVAQWHRIHSAPQPLPTPEAPMFLITFHPGGTYLVCGARATKLDSPSATYWHAQGIPSYDAPTNLTPAAILP